jgi:cohesin complex subunit SA-1/2
MIDAILNPAAALQSIVEDFLESLPQTPGPALADLINCILRACGCNESVDADTVVDYDGVVDALDNFTEGLKQVQLFYFSVIYHELKHIRLLPYRKIRPYTP